MHSGASKSRLSIDAVTSFAQETVLGQKFVVDADLSCDLRKAGQNDDLDATVSYAEVYRCKSMLAGNDCASPCYSHGVLQAQTAVTSLEYLCTSHCCSLSLDSSASQHRISPAFALQADQVCCGGATPQAG